MSLIASVFLTAGLTLWIYGMVREWHGGYSYDAATAIIGRWGSIGLIVISGLAEPKLRRYLLLGSIGLLFFFAASIGEAI